VNLQHEHAPCRAVPGVYSNQSRLLTLLNSVTANIAYLWTVMPTASG